MDDSREPSQFVDLTQIPYKVLISMESQKQRRDNAQRQFSGLGITVEWKIPVKISDIPWKLMPSIYHQHPKYASQALTLVEVFTEAKRRNVDSFMLFEDDIVFHPNFRALISHIKVPRDWRFIYLGGRNGGKREWVTEFLVRGAFVSDLHAVIIRTEMVALLEAVLFDPIIRSQWADFRIATLHKQYPAYLCRPNLAWQSVHSDESGICPYSNYNADGTVVVGKGN